MLLSRSRAYHLSITCDGLARTQRRLDSSVQGDMGKFYFSVSCLQTSRATHLCVVINMDAIDRQEAESTSFKSSSCLFLHCCDMLNLLTYSVVSRLFLMINGLFAHFGFEKKIPFERRMFILQLSEEIRRQVFFAGCKLKFHYNWKTAGTKKERQSDRLAVTVT